MCPPPACNAPSLTCACFCVCHSLTAAAAALPPVVASHRRHRWAFSFKAAASSRRQPLPPSPHYIRDDDAILTLETMRLLEGDLARLTSARSTAKFVKLAVDPYTTSVKEFIKLMRADV